MTCCKQNDVMTVLVCMSLHHKKIHMNTTYFKNAYFWRCHFAGFHWRLCVSFLNFPAKYSKDLQKIKKKKKKKKKKISLLFPESGQGGTLVSHPPATLRTWVGFSCEMTKIDQSYDLFQIQICRVANNAATIWQIAKRLVVKSGSLAWQSACEGSEEKWDLSHVVEGHESDPSDKSKQLLKGKDYKTEYLYLNWVPDSIFTTVSH